MEEYVDLTEYIQSIENGIDKGIRPFKQGIIDEILELKEALKHPKASTHVYNKMGCSKCFIYL